MKFRNQKSPGFKLRMNLSVASAVVAFAGAGCSLVSDMRSDKKGSEQYALNSETSDPFAAEPSGPEISGECPIETPGDSMSDMPIETGAPGKVGRFGLTCSNDQIEPPAPLRFDFVNIGSSPISIRVGVFIQVVSVFSGSWLRNADGQLSQLSRPYVIPPATQDGPGHLSVRFNFPEVAQDGQFTRQQYIDFIESVRPEVYEPRRRPFNAFLVDPSSANTARMVSDLLVNGILTLTYTSVPPVNPTDVPPTTPLPPLPTQGDEPPLDTEAACFGTVAQPVCVNPLTANSTAETTVGANLPQGSCSTTVASGQKFKLVHNAAQVLCAPMEVGDRANWRLYVGVVDWWSSATHAGSRNPDRAMIVTAPETLNSRKEVPSMDTEPVPAANEVDLACVCNLGNGYSSNTEAPIEGQTCQTPDGFQGSRQCLSTVVILNYSNPRCDAEAFPSSLNAFTYRNNGGWAGPFPQTVQNCSRQLVPASKVPLNQL